MKSQALIALAPLLSLGLIGCSNDVVLSRAQGPQYTATVSKRNSGAMSRGSTLVSIRANSVSDDSTHGQVVFGIDGDHPIMVQWTDPHDLAVNCSSCKPEDVNFEAVKAGETTIRYGNSLQVSR
jgi:hypothetical protein